MQLIIIFIFDIDIRTDNNIIFHFLLLFLYKQCLYIHYKYNKIYIHFMFQTNYSNIFSYIDV